MSLNLRARDMMSKDVVTTGEDLTIKQAIDILCKRHENALVVTDEDGKVSGIFTEWDVIKVVSDEVPLDKPLRDVISRNVITIGEDETFDVARQLFRDRRLRHLPVVDKEGRLVGILDMRRVFEGIIGTSPS